MRSKQVIGLIGMGVMAAAGFQGDARAGDIKIVEGIPPGFELVRLTDDPTMEHSVPDINDAGEVVFGKFVTGTETWNLYTFSNGRIESFIEDVTIDLKPVINNQSDIAWVRAQTLDGPLEILTTYTDEPVDGDADPVGFLDMNDSGDIVWQHPLVPGGAEFDIYLYTHADGNVTQLTDGGNNQTANINNHGDVVWRLRDDDVNPWTSRVLVYSDGVITDITPGECQCTGTDINDLGHVVWKDNIGLQFWDGETVTMITEIASTPRINNTDEIAFAKWDDRLQLWRHSIFKDGTVYVLPNFGFSTSRSALNDRGEVAMRYRNTNDGHRNLFLLRREGTKGDFNHDCVIDLHDAWILQGCGTAQPGPEGELLAECIRGDFDGDNDIDSEDWAAFIVGYTGPGSPIDGCEP